MQPLGPYQILLVDNDSENIGFTVNLLSQWGLNVSIAKDGEEAIELTKSDTYDLILMAIQMTGMDGPETARIIRCLGDQFEQVPIIGFSNLPGMQVEESLNDFVLKPFNQTELYDKLKKHLAKDEFNIIMANLDRCTEGDTEFRKELAQLLANNISELLGNVEKALALKDPIIFGRAVHKTKTTLSILGDGALTEELTIIQTKIGDGTSLVELGHHVQNLNNKCKNTIHILNTLSTL